MFLGNILPQSLIAHEKQKSPEIFPKQATRISANANRDNEIEILEEGNSAMYYLTERVQTKVSPKKPSKGSSRKPRILKKPPTIDYRFIERFASAWRCKICSTKFLAMDHSEEEHPVAMTLK